jgi:hypothetical protein
MSDEVEKTEEDQLEDALEATPAATPATETLPDDEASAVVEPPDPPAKPPETEAKAAPAPRKPRTQAQKDKRKADDARRKKAIADAPRAPDPSKEDAAEQERKAELRAKMAVIQGEIDDLETAADEKRTELRATSGELHPHLTASDHHVDAVRGYIASQKKERANRASNPARIKAILEAAGKSPIDSAFSAQRARGAKRPARPQATVKPTGGDAAPGADQTAAGAE